MRWWSARQAAVSARRPAGRQCGLPRSPLGGFRGTVDSIDDKTMLVSTHGTDGSSTKTTVEYNDLTLFADRHRVNADAVVEGKCIIAGGTNDTGGVLQAQTINMPLVVNGELPAAQGLKNQSRLLDGEHHFRRLHQHGDRPSGRESQVLNGFAGDGRGDHLVPAVKAHLHRRHHLTEVDFGHRAGQLVARDRRMDTLRWAVGVAGFSSASTVRNDHSMRICGHLW